MTAAFLRFLLLSCLAWHSAAAQQEPARLLHQLLEQDQAFQKQEFSAPGLPFPAIAAGEQKRRADYYRQNLAQLQTIDPAGLERSDRITYELFRFVLEDRIAEIEFEAYLVPLNAEGGWFTDFWLSASNQRLDSEEACRNYLAQLAGFEAWAAQNIQLMAAGLAKGRTAPYDILRGREGIVDALIVEQAEDSPFYRPLERLPEVIPAATRDSLQAAGRRAIMESVVPGYRAFREFWVERYLPGAARAPGIAAQPAAGLITSNGCVISRPCP
jgi:uncharacterized protein (DUF885 family)